MVAGYFFDSRPQPRKGDIMRIPAAKKLLEEIVVNNLMEYKKGRSHNNFLIPFFAGDPGIGKTQIPKQVAKAHDLPYFQTIAAQFDPGELAGLPFMGEVEITDETDKEGRKTKSHFETRMIRLRPSYLPDINDANQRVGIYNLDELPQTLLAGQNIMSQLVNEYRIGEHELSRGLSICCTGNKPENKAGTVTMPAHLKDRLMYVEVEANAEDWLGYAQQPNEDGDGPLVDTRIRAFIRQHPGKLSMFTPGAHASPTPRSWEKNSKIINMDLPKEVRREAMGGQIAEGMATTFEEWLRVEDEMPKIEDIIAHPDDAPLFGNSKADILYLLLGSLADRSDKKNIGAILKYINRLPNKEFCAVFASDAFVQHPELLQIREVTEWKMKHASKLFF